MATKTIKTRIQNKHEPQANWDKATSFVPLAGELIVYEPDSNYAYPRFKIGDGKTVVGSLPFLHTLRTNGTGNGDLGDITVDYTSGNVAVKDDSHNHVISNVDGLQTKLNSIDASIESLDANKADKAQGVFYIEGTGTTDATNKVTIWTGTHSDITAYYNGLTILYKISVAGEDTTKLNINNLGDIVVVKNATTAIETSYPVDSVIMLTYTTDSSGTSYWKTSDYNTNTTYTNVKLGHGYATCSTAASTTAKVGTLSSYTLTTGGIVAVKFTNAVPANSTLNINSKGAKSIYFRGAKITDGIIKAGDVATFIYSSYYHLISIDRWQNDITTLQSTVGSKAAAGHTHTVSHTPAGSVSQPTFTGTEAGHTHSFSVSGGGSHGHSFTGTAASHDHSFTGTGTLIKAAFKGTEQTASVSYTPAGTVSTPTITVTPNTATVNSITAVGSLPSLTYSEVKPSKITNWSAGSVPSLTFTQGSLPSASLSGGSASLTGSVSSTGPNRTVTLSLNHSNPTLSFSAGTLPTATFSAGSVPSLTYEEVAADNITAWSAGTLPTKGSNTTVVTSIKSATSTQPSFTGTAATISHKHTPAGTITVTTAAPGSGETANYTPVGTVGSKSLTPAGTVAANTISVSGTTGETKLTPAGTVSKPTFTGTAATLTTSASNS